MKRSSPSLITREVQIKTTMDSTSHPLGWLLSKKPKVSVGEGVEKLEPLFIASGNGDLHSHRGILTVLLQKSKRSITRGSSNFTARQILKTTEKRDSAICTIVFITTRWKQAKCLLMAEEISKIWQIYAVKYYPVLKGMSDIWQCKWTLRTWC